MDIVELVKCYEKNYNDTFKSLKKPKKSIKERTRKKKTIEDILPIFFIIFGILTFFVFEIILLLNFLEIVEIKKMIIIEAVLAVVLTVFLVISMRIISKRDSKKLLENQKLITKYDLAKMRCLNTILEKNGILYKNYENTNSLISEINRIINEKESTMIIIKFIFQLILGISSVLTSIFLGFLLNKYFALLRLAKILLLLSISVSLMVGFLFTIILVLVKGFITSRTKKYYDIISLLRLSQMLDLNMIHYINEIDGSEFEVSQNVDKNAVTDMVGVQSRMLETNGKNTQEFKKHKLGERMIKVGIVGYGNLGKACEEIAHADDRFELVGIYTRRDPRNMISEFGSKFYSQSDLKKFKDKIDVVLLCVGSANDLRDLAAEVGKDFCTVDSFDNHAEMKMHFNEMNEVAIKNDKVALVGIGWDPGIFSIMRGLFDGVTPKDTVHTFWGKGVSQGHSEAIRKINGVKYAIQYTVPKEDIVEELKKGKRVDLDSKQKHIRECYVVCDKNDEKRIEDEIKSIPNYFVGYETKVHFISENEFLNKHQEMPHGGLVIKNAEVSGKKEQMEFSLKLESNPKYTASVLMSYAIANYQFQKIHHYGAKTILDVPISFLLGEESISYV